VNWLERFKAKFKQGAHDECWLWTAGTNQDGYGRFRVDGTKKQAHHVAYFLAHGRWPKYIAHSCDTPACVNPAHLRESSHRENILECWEKGRGRSGRYYKFLPHAREMLKAGWRNRDIVRTLGVPNDFVSRLRNGTLYQRERAA
jgi:hypothetical protein